MRHAIELLAKLASKSLIRSLVAAAATAIVLAPQPVRAEAYINPWAGVIFGNEQANQGLRSVGVAVGEAGGNVWGTETNIALAPAFFGAGGIENYVLDIMAGVTLGPTFNPRSQHPVRPFSIVEVGLIRTSIDAETSTDKFARNDFGYCVGGGLSIAFGDQLGLRGDVRYFKAFSSDDALNSLNVRLQDFNFWRVQFGVTLR